MLCRICNEDKDETQFHLRTDSGKRRTECTPCRGKRSLKDYHRNPTRKAQHLKASRKYYLKKLYGLTLDQYEEMLRERGYKCDICGDEEKTGRSLAVDHCHTHGNIRGLLCQPCNTAIGKLKDDPTLLRKAALYIENTCL